MTWKVVPLSQGQLLDVRKEDVLSGGDFRLCETYRGGGGYDQFPSIIEKRSGKNHHKQFIVQLFGCNLDCPYCYVTRAGVWSKPKQLTTLQLVEAFQSAHETHEATVFHLMGGAPALQLKQWPALIEALASVKFEYVFHSDFLLTEGVYSEDVLKKLARKDCLFAVDVKGLTKEEHLRNTRKPFQEELFWKNLGRLEETKVPYYVTFTAVETPSLFWKKFQELWPKSYERVVSESFSINLIDYEAAPHIDDVPWEVVNDPLPGHGNHSSD